MDGIERALNLNKPFVFDSDITDGCYEWLIEGLDFATKAANNPKDEVNWQIECIKLLQSDSPLRNEHANMQKSINKSFFDKINNS
ncbi:hypothetical protein [Aureibacter tunicatorum]|uniref:Uncharacterized protein n=1 Tax=Aureibacter tunicatorum TaxID=866807 RepID=A0AAE4BVD9_9BACT|nr:hypothetical protein [Aureibacter tunicatorum]MDR6241797.1 hypothetical protein [Aureibacter tunicatorum]